MLNISVIIDVILIYICSEKREDIARIKEELRAKGCSVPPDKPESSHFDSNCITPVSDAFFFHTLSSLFPHYCQG